jgi:secretion/DNA translocation related TadE-like protein
VSRAEEGSRVEDSGADEGSATLWLLGFAGVVLAAALTATVLGRALVARARAATAADLAALAAASVRLEGRPAACRTAADTARRNSARLVSCTWRGELVTVRVTAWARGLGPVPGHRVEALARAGPAHLAVSRAAHPQPVRQPSGQPAEGRRGLSGPAAG